jgi:hypothetical protein
MGSFIGFTPGRVIFRWWGVNMPASISTAISASSRRATTVGEFLDSHGIDREDLPDVIDVQAAPPPAQLHQVIDRCRRYHWRVSRISKIGWSTACRKVRTRSSCSNRASAPYKLHSTSRRLCQLNTRESVFRCSLRESKILSSYAARLLVCGLLCRSSPSQLNLRELRLLGRTPFTLEAHQQARPKRYTNYRGDAAYSDYQS